MAVLAPRGWERGSADASEPGAVGGVATRRGEGSCFTPWRFHTFTGLATSPSPAACPGPPSTGRAGRADALLQTPTPWLRAGALARPFSTAHQFHLEEGSGKVKRGNAGQEAPHIHEAAGQQSRAVGLALAQVYLWGAGLGTGVLWAHRSLAQSWSRPSGAKLWRVWTSAAPWGQGPSSGKPQTPCQFSSLGTFSSLHLLLQSITKHNRDGGT